MPCRWDVVPLARRTVCLAIVAGVGLIAGACSTGRAVHDAAPPEPGFAASAPTTTVRVASGGTLRVGLVGIDQLDPATVSPVSPSSVLLTDLLYDGLTGYDATRGTVVGALASSWGASADGLTWRFEIDPDARFADGTRVEPADVKATIERVAALGDRVLSGARLDAIVGHGEFVAGSAGEIAGLVLSGSTLEVRLRTPMSALPELFADPAFGVLKAAEARRGALDPVPTGSGPFQVRGRTAEAITLVRSARSSATVGEIEARLYPDAAAAYAAFERGEIDQAPVPAGGASSLPAGARLVQAPQQVGVVFGMNVASPVLSDVRMRQAIVRAVDREAVRAAVFPGALALRGVIGPGVSGHRADACGALCTPDPAAARALVAEVYPDGAVPTVHVDFFVDDSGREAALASAVVVALQAAGIPAQARPHGIEDFQSFLLGGAAELFRYGWVGSFPSAEAYLSPFETRGVDNVYSLADDAFGAALAAARATTAEPQRAAAYAAAEDRLLSFAPVLPLAQHQIHLVVRDNVRDVVLTPGGSIDIARVTVSS